MGAEFLSPLLFSHFSSYFCLCFFSTKVTTLNLANMLADRQHCALVLACDGLFEVMSNEEVGKEVIRMREAGYAPGEVRCFCFELSCGF